MASLSENREILDGFGDRVIKAAQANLRRKRQIRGRSVNRIDTGNLSSKLTYGYFKRGPKILQWFGVPANDEATRNYADVIEKGRTPNNNPVTWPPVAPIYAWMGRKGLFDPQADDEATRNYADVIEKGRTPNNNPVTWPPVAPIYAWMGRKGLFDPQADEKRKWWQASRMARSIGKRGIVPVFYMRDAFQTEFRKSGAEFREFYTREILKQLRLKADKYIK